MVDGAMQWKRHVLDYSTRTGAGMQIVVEGVDGDGNQEIVVAGKSGLFLFENMSAQRRSEEHTSELQSPCNLACRLLLDKKQARIAGGLAGAIVSRSGW